jgi:antitoxin component YwqK of YwqJK toxin-antitoxin module
MPAGAISLQEAIVPKISPLLPDENYSGRGSWKAKRIPGGFPMRQLCVIAIAVTIFALAGKASSEEPRRFPRSGAQARRATEPPKTNAKTPAAQAPLKQETPEVATDAIHETPVIDATAQAEVIRERYPSRGIRIERHVVQDVQLNYVNHGPWSWWDEHGQLLAKGEYKVGKQHGKWIRIHMEERGTIFALPMYKGFERPLTSEATFEDGVLHGAWTVTDVKGRKVSQWMFDQGRQHGLATWWHTNGQALRTANYTDGLIDGELREFNSKGEVLAKETYVNGFKLDLETTNYPKTNRKRSERSVLVPVARQHYNWFDATVSLDKVEQPRIYHGLSTWWYADGQKEMTGQFEHGVPAGQYVWWHANGQERSRGEYVNGKQSGKWIWWHANGQKEMEGDYHLGQRVGKWAAWSEDGKVRLVEEHPAMQEQPAVASGQHDKQASVK